MGARLSIEKVNEKDLLLEYLPRETRSAFLYCAEQLNFLAKSGWYLAGGTALALQAGHRQSVDLDFFLPQANFQETILERQLFASGKWNTSFRAKGTLYGILLKAKVSFIAYPFFQPSVRRKRFGNVDILNPEDIAVMKIIAISQRGRKRDFADIFWYVKNRESLFDVILRAVNQYAGQADNLNHILRSLAYFEDAEEDPMPKLYFQTTWKEIKKYFQREVSRITKEFFGLK